MSDIYIPKEQMTIKTCVPELQMSNYGLWNQRWDYEQFKHLARKVLNDNGYNVTEVWPTYWDDWDFRQCHCHGYPEVSPILTEAEYVPTFMVGYKDTDGRTRYLDVPVKVRQHIHELLMQIPIGTYLE